MQLCDIRVKHVVSRSWEVVKFQVIIQVYRTIKTQVSVQDSLKTTPSFGPDLLLFWTWVSVWTSVNSGDLQSDYLDDVTADYTVVLYTLLHCSLCFIGWFCFKQINYFFPEEFCDCHVCSYCFFCPQFEKWCLTTNLPTGNKSTLELICGHRGTNVILDQDAESWFPSMVRPEQPLV